MPTDRHIIYSLSKNNEKQHICGLQIDQTHLVLATSQVTQIMSTFPEGVKNKNSHLM